MFKKERKIGKKSRDINLGGNYSLICHIVTGRPCSPFLFPGKIPLNVLVRGQCFVNFLHRLPLTPIKKLKFE